MEEAHPARPEPTWWFLAAAILLCGLLMASLRTGKVAVPFLGTVKRAEHPVSFWTICAAQLILGLAVLSIHVRQFPIACPL
jgi:hypothetical protein